MARYLITQSLLSAWLYTFNCFEGCEEDAMADFLSALDREKKEPTQAMQNGIEFENAVYQQSHGIPREPTASGKPAFGRWQPSLETLRYK